MTQNRIPFTKLRSMSELELLELRNNIDDTLYRRRETRRNALEVDNRILTIKEATLFADLFDEIGEYENANFMDKYTQEILKTDGDLIKQAGLFRNLLNKLFGFGKRVFFKVYRELYAEAKKAQEKLDERINTINESYKKIREDLRYHDLEGWRGGVYALNLSDSKEIMKDFDTSYGKLVSYLGLTGKDREEEVPSEEGLSQIEKLPEAGGAPPEAPPEAPPGTERLKSWERMTPGAREGWNEISANLSFNPSQGSLRFNKKYFDYILGKHVSTDGAGNVKYWSTYAEHKQPMGGKIKNLMGGNVWTMKEDGGFVYLYPKSRGSDIGSPPIKIEPPSEEEFKAPKLPEQEAVPTGKSEEKAPLEKPEVLEPIEEKPEEIVEKGLEKPEVVEEKPEVVEEKPEVVEEKPEVEEPIAAKFVKKQPARRALWVAINRPNRGFDGNLWTRFTKVYPETAKKYERQDKGKVVVDQNFIEFLDKLVPIDFPEHKANVLKISLPTDEKLRDEYIDKLNELVIKKSKTSSRIEQIKKLHKRSMRDKWSRAEA